MTTILSYIKASDGYFEPEVLGAMSIAYDAVRKSLGSAATVTVCDGVANRIIEAGRTGERDRIRLIEVGLGSLRYKP
jgi:hypothetical protein